MKSENRKENRKLKILSHLCVAKNVKIALDVSGRGRRLMRLGIQVFFEVNRDVKIRESFGAMMMKFRGFLQDSFDVLC